MRRLLLAVIFAVPLAVSAAEPASVTAPEGGGSAPAIRSVFGPGEQTTYEVSYLGIVAGQAQLTVGWTMEQYGREVWPLVCVGQSANVASIWRVNDRFVSYWDPRAREAVGADFFLDENKKRRRERYFYDREAGQAVATKQKEGQAPYEVRYDMAPGTLDLAAAGFSLRNVPLSIGLTHEFPIFTGLKVYTMTAKVEGRETIDTKLGRVEAYRVTVNGDFNGQLATKGLMTLFYTADEKQLPVRAEAEFLLGKVLLEAVKYSPGRAY